MNIRKDIWRCAIVQAPIAEILSKGSLANLPLVWLRGSGNLRYLADPFGLWRDGRLFVFTESFDYRDARGRIIVSEFDQKLDLIRQLEVLSEPWHLSYPYVWEADGETWLLPESYGSGGLWLYRSTRFPDRWERACRIALDDVPLDATPYHDGVRWWLFYAPAYPAEVRLTHLCAAYAERLEGPWQTYSKNPVLIDSHGARPGGTPIRINNALYLPVQDCVGTYGAAVRFLRFDVLSPDRVVAVPTDSIHAPASAAPFTDGCHTLSSAGPVTLIDVKQTVVSLRALLMRPMRVLYRLARMLRVTRA